MVMVLVVVLSGGRLVVVAVMGGSRCEAQGARAPSKPMAAEAGQFC